MSKFYRVHTGYGPDEFIQIDETELEMCIKAQITGKVAITKQGTVSGNIIQKIVPDWNRVLGYSRLYKLQAEDYNDIKKSVREDHFNLIEDTTRKIQNLPPVQRIEGPRIYTKGPTAIKNLLPKKDPQ